MHSDMFIQNEDSVYNCRQQATAKKATMGNVMNNMMRHKRLEGGGPEKDMGRVEEERSWYEAFS